MTGFSLTPPCPLCALPTVNVIPQGQAHAWTFVCACCGGGTIGPDRWCSHAPKPVESVTDVTVTE